MGKKSFWLILIILAAYASTGCRSPKTALTKIDTINVSIESEDLDTMKRHKTKIITIEKSDSGTTKITVDETETETKSSHGRHGRQEVKNQKEEKTDNLSPTMKKLENKGVKDSLKQIVRLEKEETKQLKQISKKDVLKLVFYTVLLLFLIALTRKIK